MTQTWDDLRGSDIIDSRDTIDRDATWPITFIDWAAAAAALQQDYTSIDIDGITYWGR